MLMAVPVLSGCGKDSDDLPTIGENEDDATLNEFNLKFSDFQRSWKLIKLINEDGNTIDLNYSFTIKDLSKCNVIVSRTDDFPHSNLHIIVNSYENAVLFSNPANTECEETLVGVMKKTSEPISDGKVYSFILSCSTDTDDDITSYVDVFSCGSPKLEGNLLKCFGSWEHTNLENYSISTTQSTGTLIFEKQ